MALTQKTINNLPAGNKLIPTGNPSQLYVRQGAKRHAYVLVYQRGGKQRKYKLGDTDTMLLSKAVEAAKDALAEIRLDKDPAAARAAAKEAAKNAPPPPPAPETFGELVPKFLAALHDKGRSKSTRKDYGRYLNEEYSGPIFHRPVNDIKRLEVSNVIDEITKRGKATGRNAAAALSSFFSWCERKGHVDASVARNVEKPDVPEPRSRWLDAAEIGKLWNHLRDRDDDWSLILALLLQTGARRREIAGLTVDEVKWDERVIEFDVDRIKNKMPYKLPITDAMMAILEKRRHRPKYLFGKSEDRPFSGFSKSQAKLLAELPKMKRFSAHDLRRTVETNMAEHELVKQEVIDSLLNHAKPGISAAYNRADYMAAKGRALNTWQNYINESAGDDRGNVVTLPAGAANAG